jgi:hypothetical protein
MTESQLRKKVDTNRQGQEGVAWVAWIVEGMWGCGVAVVSAYPCGPKTGQNASTRTVINFDKAAMTRVSTLIAISPAASRANGAIAQPR